MKNFRMAPGQEIKLFLILVKLGHLLSHRADVYICRAYKIFAFIPTGWHIPYTCHPGGVEPIAEVADGDGEELELPQEVTKLIKKKQPSKKVKKGRSTNSSINPHRLLYCHLFFPSFVSLFGAEYPPALTAPVCQLCFTLSHFQPTRVKIHHSSGTFVALLPACH